jgi:hypothetical protein
VNPATQNANANANANAKGWSYLVGSSVATACTATAFVRLITTDMDPPFMSSEPVNNSAPHLA